MKIFKTLALRISGLHDLPPPVLEQCSFPQYVLNGGYDKEDNAAISYDLTALKYWGTLITTNFPIRAGCFSEILTGSLLAHPLLNFVFNSVRSKQKVNCPTQVSVPSYHHLKERKSLTKAQGVHQPFT